MPDLRYALPAVGNNAQGGLPTEARTPDGWWDNMKA